MEQLINRLNQISNSYYEFVDSVADYARKNEAHLELLMNYIDSNESATPSDIIKFISSQSDFFEDSVPEDVDSLVV